MDKYDIKKTHRELYSPPSKEFTVVEVPKFRYIAVDGRGDPNTSPAYANAIEALYGVAYALKFASKKTLGRDFVVGPLEGLWRADDPTEFVTRRKQNWAWTMMISQPDWITEDMVRTAIDNVAKKKETPHSETSGCSPSSKGPASRSCTSAPTTTKLPPWTASTTTISPRTASPSTVTITRSTSATHVEQHPPSSKRS